MYLDWDSRLFGYPVVKIQYTEGFDLKRLLEHLRREKVRLTYVFSKSTSYITKAILEAFNGALVDEKITYRIKINNLKAVRDNDSHITSYDAPMVHEDLLSLALQAGVFSRFFVDKYFTQNEYDKLYRTWMELSVRRIIAFDVLQYVDETGNIKGVITLEEKSKSATIGLLAVDRNYRGKLYGKELVMKALQAFRKRGYSEVFVTTQEKNIIACKFYESLGFSAYRKEHVYHFWL